MARPFIALFTVLVATFLAVPAEAQWKWRDKAGHVQYSDIPPPPGVPDQDILGRPAAAQRRSAAAATAASAASAPALTAAASPLAPKTVEPELEAARRKAEQDQAAKNKELEARVATAKAENCARARNQMKTFDSGIRITRTNDKTGEREFLDDKQRADEAKRMQGVIAADCK